MTSNQATKSPDTLKISQMLRTSTVNKMDLITEVKKDIKQSIFDNSKNNFDFYNAQTDIIIPKKMNLTQSYKSVQKIRDPRLRKQLNDTFKEPQHKTHFEKEVISEIRQEHGRNVLLSDVYHELSKENNTTPKSQRAKLMTVNKEQTKVNASKEVEDLDKWTQEKIHNIKLKHHSEVEELKKEVTRMMFFMEEEGVTMSDRRAVDSILEEIDASQKNNMLEGGFGSYKNEERAMGDSTKGLMMSKTLKQLTSLPRIQNKMKEQESMEYMGTGSLSLTESFYSVNSKLPLKQRLSHFRSLHLPIEQKLSRQIEGIEGELERRRQAIEKLSSQSEQLNKRATQLVEYIDALSDKMDQLFEKQLEAGPNEEEYWSQMPSIIAKEEKKRRAEQERKEKEMLKNFKEELGRCRRQLEYNEPEIKRNENESAALKKKMSVFMRIKSKLYMKILKQGLDCREEGLVWVLKDLMKEGENITYDDFPAFLDNSSRTHLMQKSRQLNHLSDLKALERSHINAFRAFTEGKLYNVQANTTGFHQKQKNAAQAATSLTHLTHFSKTPTSKDRKVRTLNEFDSFQSACASRLDSTISLNELDFDSDDHENSLESFGRSGYTITKKTSPVNEQKLKSISLAFIPEEKEEEQESPYPRVAKRNQTVHFSKLMSMNDVKSKNNLNESLVQETKSVLGQVCREKVALNRSQTWKSKMEDSSVTENNNNTTATNLTTKNQNKAEMLAKIHSVQSDIEMAMQKIREDDQKEGLRIMKEYDPKKEKMDLEFYLACVLGTVQADKFFKRFALKTQI